MAKEKLEMDVKVNVELPRFEFLWMIEPMRFTAAINAGMVDVKAFINEFESREQLQITADGIAVIPVMGPIVKGSSFFGGRSSIQVRNLLAQAVKADEVKGIMIHIDSPGGHVAGTKELADDIIAADKIKPVFAHADDLMASAALWIGVVARQVTANSMALVGSIGTFTILDDFSKAFEDAGVKVHVVTSSGAEKFKAAGAFGTEVTEEQIEDVKTMIDDINGFFLKAVSKGRGLNMAEVRQIADGRVHIASKAQSLGLIDGVNSFETAINGLKKEINAAGRGGRINRQKARLARMQREN